MEEIQKKEIFRLGAGVSGFLLMPAVSYLLFEYVTGNLGTISPEMAALNIGLNLVLYLLLLGITGTTRIAVPAAAAILYVASLAETFVVSFRSRPIMIYDLLAVRTAMTVSGNYEYEISPQMKDAGLLLLLCGIFLWFVPLHVRGLKKRLACGGICTGAAALLLGVFYLRIVPGRNLCINMWNVSSTYEKEGFVLSTAVSLRYVVRRPPAGYSQARLHEVLKRLTDDGSGGDSFTGDAETQAAPGMGEEENAAAGKTVPVNLICIMNESLSDLRVAGDFETNEEYFPYLNSLTENTIRGSLCVPVFGAGTSNSEFEFLTGDSIQMLPACTNAYQFNVKPGTDSLVSTVKAQGYRTLAMHPYPAENWNRDRVYVNLGFDEFLDEDYYAGGETFRTYISDRADFRKLIEQVEAKENPEEKLFIFNVTMQNHGGYEVDFDNQPVDIHLTGALEGKYPKTDQYLTLVKMTDMAFEELLSYFRDLDQPTMIVMFGDHQPGVEDEFYDEIAGKPAAEVANADRLMWYETPFVIWTNYEQPSRDMGKLGSIYLSSYVLQAAGLELTPYQKLLMELSGQLPVLHIIGCYDADDTYYSWSEAEASGQPWSSLLLDYEAAAYNHSVDGRKVTELFRLP